MAMAAACKLRWTIVPSLASSTVMRRWETRRPGVVSTQERLVNLRINGRRRPEWRQYVTPDPACYGTFLFSARDIEKLSRSKGNSNFDLAVDKAIQHYHKHVKVEEEDDGPSRMIYPVRGASKYISGLEMYHILLQTRGGQKYVAIYVAPKVNYFVKLDDEAFKLVFFSKVDSNVALPFRRVVGQVKWPVCPRNNPLITAAATFALAQHNKEEKLTHLIRATSQLVGDYEIFRMTFKGEFSSMYDAIVLVPQNNPEKMELVKFKISNGWGMYGRLISSSYSSKVIYLHIGPVRRYYYEDKVEAEVEDDSECQYEDDECVVNDPRVTAAARFALAQFNEKDHVRLDNKKDQVRRVVEATRRTYSGDEIFDMKFDGELDGSWIYHAIVLVPVNDPEKMRLAYCGRNYDDPDPYIGEYEDGFEVDEDGFEVDEDSEECSVDDPQVMEAARLALATCNRKDKLLRVVRAISENDSKGGVTYTMRLVGEDHPLRTFMAVVQVYPQGRLGTRNMRVDGIFPEVDDPSRRARGKK